MNKSHRLWFNIRKSQIWLSSSIESYNLIHSTFDVQYEYQGRIRERTLYLDIKIRQSWLQHDILILHRCTILCLHLEYFIQWSNPHLSY